MGTSPSPGGRGTTSWSNGLQLNLASMPVLGEVVYMADDNPLTDMARRYSIGQGRILIWN